MARIISGEITKPSETTVTEEGNQENAEPEAPKLFSSDLSTWSLS